MLRPGHSRTTAERALTDLWRKAMARTPRLLALLSLLAFVAAAIAPASASASLGSDLTASIKAQLPTPGPGFVERIEDSVAKDINVCSYAHAADAAHCSARVRTDATALAAKPARRGEAPKPNVVGGNGAYDPCYIRSAYNLGNVGSFCPNSSGTINPGSGPTVAIVDAYDDPNAESDLANYRSTYGLGTCSTANHCFTKIDQNGGTSYPSSDTGWALEISLDVDMVSTICPNCKILLVEASSNYFTDLGAAVNRAVSMGAVVVSNSYGGGEFSGETSYDTSYYNHPGIAITVSSGDSGYGVEYPAASRYVTAVGGTNLFQNSNSGSRNGSETAWSGAGSGCSSFESKPSWQTDTGCSRRTVADVSAVASCSTPV